MARVVASTVTATALLMTAACSTNDEQQTADDREKQQITDILGREVEVPKDVDRVLMGGQRMLYTTAILNKEKPLQGIVAWPDDLEQNDPGTYKKYEQKFSEIEDIEQTGEVYDGSMSVEQALNSRPDVFIVSASSFEAAQDAGIVDGLEKAGIPTVTVDYFTDPVKNTAPSVRLLGKVLGHEKEAEEYAEFYESKVNMVQERLEKAKAAPTPTFLWRAPGYFDCCSTFAKSNLAQIVNAAGGENVGDDMIDAKQGQVSPEALAEKAPDVIIATGADWTGAKQQPKKNGFVPLGYDESTEQAAKDFQRVVDGQPVLKEMRAVKHKRAYAAWHHFYDSPYNYLAIEWFAKAMHPDLFSDVDPQADLEELHGKFLPVEASGTFWTGLP
ncbi:ABC transporter substrate-binding protein [Corynebacterium accolens]|uniref:ABC transporter substrate-binding protein n=1 Tax=Corynebacterium accolens TaxID=38284 RepID=UPI0025428118|nr:ABC transporter substrate-binding protein [Corynebacterium accolens]MDK4331506.1 ABC transporter substrate-binding protein [Corynebacterium accolens]